MPVLTADHITKSFSHRTVLEDVSVAVEAGERVGLIGSNGSGKSTLGRILAGVDEPDGGVIARSRDTEFAYLAQEPVLDPELTAYETVERGLLRWRDAVRRYEQVGEKLARGEGEQQALLAEQAALMAEIEGLGGWDLSHRVRAMLEHLGIERPEQRVGTMSGGERRRVALARLLVARPGLAVLDEPTNHLDADTAEWLEDHLANDFAGALILITHDRYFLDRVVTRVLELDRGRVSSFEGNYEKYLELKAERLEHEARVEANRMNLLRRERDWLSRRAPARTSKQKARIKRAEALECTVRESRRADERASFSLAAMRTGKRILELRDVSKTIGGRTLFEHLDLVMTPGERLGVIGKNGAGKTTLLRMILGEEPPSRGEIVLGQNTRIAYFDQQRAGLEDDKTVFDNLSEGSDKVRLGDEYVNVQSYLERFLFDGAKQRQVVGSLSGGERARVALAKMMRGGANLVILDEPTNDLDLVTLASLEDLLISFNGCVIVVTHDRYFLDRVATSVLSFEGGGRVLRYAGGYEDYCMQRALANAQRGASARAEREERGARERGDARAAEKRAKLTLAEEKELAALPEAIDEAERVVRAIEEQLNDPSLYSTRAWEIAGLKQKLAEAQAVFEARMARWEALETKKAG